MKEFSPSDVFEVRPQSLFSSRDRDYLLDFYAPLVGIKALAFYFALTEESAGEAVSFESFLKKNQGSLGELLSSLNALEAVGLVASYVKQGEKFAYFVFALYAPKTPKEFFDNVLFIGTLRKYLDNDKIEALSRKYALLPLPNDFANVSEGFRDYFSPDFDDPVFQEETPKTGGRKTGAIQTGFDKNAFLRALSEQDPRFNLDSFSEEELVKIARLSALYSYSEETMASFVYPHYVFAKEKGSRVDFPYVEKDAKDSLRFSYLHKTPAKKSEVHDDGALARTIRAMDTLSPVEFLSKLQKGNKPASSDLALLEELTVEMGLSAPLCNALVFYVITTKDGQLPNKYAEKIAASLMRKGIETSLDAMNYFSMGKKTYTKPASVENPAPVVVEETKPSATLTDQEKAITDAQFDELMGELYNPTKGAK
jgi:replication initiation and membrane attachment protein DnaB